MKQICFCMIFSVLIPCMVNATELVPPGRNDFYYKIGGGQPIPMPAFIDQQTVPLDVTEDLGAGYNCGVFNPKSSLVNSFNDIKDSFINMSQTLIKNATSAIMEFPLYEVARANTTLYNLITNNEFGAWNNFALSTKSCQAMQNEIAEGKNPYHDWAEASLNNDWKHYMSFNNAEHLGTNQAMANGIDASDINQVRQQIAKDNGKTGVPWVNGVDVGRGSLYAGGEGQPPIEVLHDISIAGYNVIIGESRTYNDLSAPLKTEQNARLVGTWTSPTAAAAWVTNNLGDEEITTYSNGSKNSTAGIGILDEIQSITQKIAQKIADMVSGKSEMTLKNLKAVSSPKMLLNQDIIQSIRTLSPVNQSIYISKIAQMMAMAQIIDKIQLAQRVLESGSQVPPVASNKPAQQRIQQAISRLTQQLHQLLFNIQLSQNTAGPLTALLESINTKELGNIMIQGSKKPAAMMEQGAISTNHGGHL